MSLPPHPHPSSFPLKRLPTELTIDILSRAAASSPKTACALALVDSTVRQLSMPAMYETVVLRTEKAVVGFASVVRAYHRGQDKGALGTSTETLPGKYVRNLCITHHAFVNTQLDDEGANQVSDSLCADSDEHKRETSPSGRCGGPYDVIFHYCTRVRRLALQATFLHSSLVGKHPVHTVWGGVKERASGTDGLELMVLGPTFPSDWVKHANAATYGGSSVDVNVNVVSPSTVLEHVTHLRLSEPLSSPQYSGQFVARLPNLTHLAVPIHEPTYVANPLRDVDALLEAVNAGQPEDSDPDSSFADTDSSSGASMDATDANNQRQQRHRSRLEQIVLIMDFRTWVDRRVGIAEWIDRARKKDRRLCVVLKEQLPTPASACTTAQGCHTAPWDEWRSGLELDTGRDIWAYARSVCG